MFSFGSSPPDSVPKGGNMWKWASMITIFLLPPCAGDGINQPAITRSLGLCRTNMATATSSSIGSGTAIRR